MTWGRRAVIVVLVVSGVALLVTGFVVGIISVWTVDPEVQGRWGATAGLLVAGGVVSVGVGAGVAA